MTLTGQITQRGHAAAEAAERRLRERQRHYTQLLARDAAPRKGDAESLAARMVELGKTSRDVAADLERIRLLRRKRAWAAEVVLREKAAADAQAAEKQARDRQTEQVATLAAVVRAAHEAAHDATVRHVRSVNSRDELPAVLRLLREAGLCPEAVDAEGPPPDDASEGEPGAANRGD